MRYGRREAGSRHSGPEAAQTSAESSPTKPPSPHTELPANQNGQPLPMGNRHCSLPPSAGRGQRGAARGHGAGQVSGPRPHWAICTTTALQARSLSNSLGGLLGTCDETARVIAGSCAEGGGRPDSPQPGRAGGDPGPLRPRLLRPPQEPMEPGLGVALPVATCWLWGWPGLPRPLPAGSRRGRPLGEPASVYSGTQ